MTVLFSTPAERDEHAIEAAYHAGVERRFPGGFAAARAAIAIAVVGHGTSLQVGDASYVEVSDGAAIDPSSGACVAKLLAGADSVSVVAALPAYAGPVEYRVPIDFGHD